MNSYLTWLYLIKMKTAWYVRQGVSQSCLVLFYLPNHGGYMSGFRLDIPVLKCISQLFAPVWAKRSFVFFLWSFRFHTFSNDLTMTWLDGINKLFVSNFTHPKDFWFHKIFKWMLNKYQDIHWPAERDQINWGITALNLECHQNISCRAV